MNLQKFFQLRQTKVNKANADLEKAKRDLIKAEKALKHAEGFWFGAQGLLWYMQTNKIDLADISDVKVKTDDVSFLEARKKILDGEKMSCCPE